ncbi:unnamed protein product [Umbelopsis ramanniana]
MAKPKAATFPRLPRFRHAQQQQPNETHNAISIPRYPHEFPDHLQERVDTSDIMLGVVAYLDIRFVDSIFCNLLSVHIFKRKTSCSVFRTDDGDDVSEDFEDALIAMGAKVRKTFTENITHLVFKNGSVSTLQRAYAKSIPVVNLLWITRSQTIGSKLDEKQFSIVRPANLSVSARRRRKSMEPGRVKELVLDPRRFSSSWMDDDSNDDIEAQPDSVNAKDMARLSLDDNVERPSKLSRRQSIGSIRQSALKFTKDLQPEGMNSNSVNKDITTPMQGLHTEQGETETNDRGHPDKTISTLAALDDPPTPRQDTGQQSTPSSLFTSRIPVPRSTIHTQLQATSSGLCFAVRSRLSSNRKPIRSQSASSVMTVPSIKPNIKSNFYFGSPQDDTTSKPTVTSSSLKRKRRSSIGPRLSLQGLERPRTPFVEHDIVIPIAKLPKLDRKTIVLTSMDKQTRRACIDAVEKLGIYTIGDEVDGSTTHIIVGCKRRTISVVFGVLRGLWLVTADWLKLSAEDGKYLPEQQYEIVEWFPKCKVTRLMVQASPGVLPGAELLCSRHIYVGKTMFDSKLIKKLVEDCGATVCDNAESATLIIGTEADEKIPTVIENWLFDCIEQFKDLTVDPYLLARI